MTEHAPDTHRPLDDSITRLCALYDGMLTNPRRAAEPPSPELAALARIFDRPAEGTAAEVWRDLRVVLARQTPAPAPEAETASRSAPAPLTLLLAEDDPDLAASLTESLVEAGHNVIGPFRNAEAAEVSAALHSIDLALLDMNLSGSKTGADLATSLRDNWGVGTVFLSGDVTATARHADLALAILTKPCSAREVLDTVARVADRTNRNAWRAE